MVLEYVDPPETAAPETGSGNDQRDAVRSSTVSPETPAPVKNSGNERQAAVRKLRILSQFLVQDNGGLRLFHPSLAEWLTKSEGENPFAVTEKEGFRRSAEACLQEVGKGKGELPDHVVINLPARRGPGLKSGSGDPKGMGTLNTVLEYVDELVRRTS